MTERKQQMQQWLDGLGYKDYSIEVASEDASFRSYYRLLQGDESWIVMDAPPEKEPCDSFVNVARQLTGIGLSAPDIIHENHEQGFLLLTDFGDDCYLPILNAKTANSLYGDAISALLNMQTRLSADDLPEYDEVLLRREMDLFKHWFLQELLGIDLSQPHLDLWNRTVDTLVASALEQPQVFVHRDYHSRNLMKIEHNNPGILDFQDAVKGPVTYDLVSLLRDCYIDWPETQVEQWVLEFHHSAESTLLNGVSASQFKRWFDLMGVQRHLKAIGIFSRLKLRDGKDKFVQDIPRTLNYLSIVGQTDKSMEGLNALLTELGLESKMNALIR